MVHTSHIASMSEASTLEDIRPVMPEPRTIGSIQLEPFHLLSVVDHVREIAKTLVTNTSEVTDAHIIASRDEATAVLLTRHNDYVGVIEIPTDPALIANYDVETTVLSHINLTTRTVSTWFTNEYDHDQVRTAVLDEVASE